MATTSEQAVTPQEFQKGTLTQSYSFDNVEFLVGDLTKSPVDAKAAAAIAEVLKTVGSKSGADAAAAGAELAQLLKAAGIRAYAECDVTQTLGKCIEDRATAEGALIAIKNIIEADTTKAESFMVPFLPKILELIADKKKAEVRTAAEEAGKAIIENVCLHGIKTVMGWLISAVESTSWQTKMWGLKYMAILAERSPVPFSRFLNKALPAISAAMWDTKKDVKEAATAAALSAMNTCENRDIKPFIPAVIDSIQNPSEIPECLHKLSSTVFVQSVDNPALSIAVPILMRGCQEKKIESKRRVCTIVDNMCKLIDYPHEATTFMPELMPAVERLSTEMSDPEARSVATRALKTLTDIKESADAFEASKAMEAAQVVEVFKKVIAEKASSVSLEDKSFIAVLEYMGCHISGMIDAMHFDEKEWKFLAVCPYLAPYMAQADAEAVCSAVREACYKACAPKEEIEDEDDDGEDLCNCEFSLGYGAKILLNNTRLHLKRGKRYGIVGHNGCGKSTLMRAIANGQVENFPPPDQLKTVFVECTIDGDDTELTIVQYIVKQLPGVAEAEIRAKLDEFGFKEDEDSPACVNNTVGRLSGGWKMKLALCRAILMNCDILLLDEPTNHLDVTNVAWLENFLCSQTDKTSLIITHDSGFLDRVVTHIIHYEANRKLKNYKGNLSAFVKRVPKAKTYYELSDENLAFTFPEPGLLDGVKSKGKAIIKMEKVSFTYPGNSKPTVYNITLQASLSSRVAVVGPNGAGKSTLIKVFTGESKPDLGKGSVWRHQNCRVAYVAQHAFHHVENHLDSTPNEYICWRYSSGEDREAVGQESKKISDEEKAKMEQVHTIRKDDGTVEKLVVEALRSRRKAKRTYEYEVKWLNKSEESNTWMEREKLEEMGWAKMVQRMDQQEALRLGLAQRPLTTKFVEKQLGDMGLEAEFATHSRIRGLSGGQKVKVVIAGAMWLNPHILVMDEPTNYLDRDSLGALAGAIRKYGGGVVLISHNREFTENLCPERWVVEAGTLKREGEVAADEKIDVEANQAPDEVMDSLGNVIKVKKEKKLTAREQKKIEKKKAERRKKGLPSESEED